MYRSCSFVDPRQVGLIFLDGHQKYQVHRLGDGHQCFLLYQKKRIFMVVLEFIVTTLR
jgi:hypothetical protein